MKKSVLLFATLSLMFQNLLAIDTLCQQAGATANTCALCYKSYFNTTTNVCTAPTTPVDNAAAYSSATAVSLCAPGYYLNASACTAIPTTCTNCAAGAMSGSTFVPTACNAGYSVSVSGSTTTCAANTTTLCPITNCSSCGSTTTCMLCADTYTRVLGSSAADTCVVGVENCYQGTATACTICKPGNYIDAGKCTAGVLSFFTKIMSLLLVFIF